LNTLSQISQRYSLVDVVVETFEDFLLTLVEEEVDEIADMVVAADNVCWICIVVDMLGEDGAMALLCGMSASSNVVEVVADIVLVC
jgi:hypothetical protein